MFEAITTTLARFSILRTPQRRDLFAYNRVPDLGSLEAEKLGETADTSFEGATTHVRQKRLKKALIWILSISLMFSATLNIMFLYFQSRPNMGEGVGLVRNCGSTPAEARALNCTFDLMISAWTPPECYPREMSDNYIQEGAFTYWEDFETRREVPLETVLLGEFEHIYVSTGYHESHCAYVWERTVWAVNNDMLVDFQSFQEEHTAHCAKLLRKPLTHGDRLTRRFLSCQAKYSKWD